MIQTRYNVLRKLFSVCNVLLNDILINMEIVCHMNILNCEFSSNIYTIELLISSLVRNTISWLVILRLLHCLFTENYHCLKDENLQTPNCFDEGIYESNHQNETKSKMRYSALYQFLFLLQVNLLMNKTFVANELRYSILIHFRFCINNIFEGSYAFKNWQVHLSRYIVFFI